MGGWLLRELVVVIGVAFVLFVFQIFRLRHPLALGLLILGRVRWGPTILILLIVGHSCWFYVKLRIDSRFKSIPSVFKMFVSPKLNHDWASQRFEITFKIILFSARSTHPASKLPLAFSPNMAKNDQLETAMSRGTVTKWYIHECVRLIIFVEYCLTPSYSFSQRASLSRIQLYLFAIIARSSSSCCYVLFTSCDLLALALNANRRAMSMSSWSSRWSCVALLRYLRCFWFEISIWGI